MRTLRVLPAIFAVLLLASCSSTPHSVRIEAQSNPPPPGTPPAQSFWIRSRQRDPSVETLRYREAVGHIKTAMSGRGLYEAPSEESADMVIELDYGVRSRRTRFDVDPSPAPAKAARAKERPKDGAKAADGEVAPSTDRREIEMDTEYFEKHVVIEARARNRPADATGPEFLWRVTAQNVSTSDDLRKYVPILAAATIDYLGKETAGAREIEVDEHGVDVTFVRKGLPASGK